MQLKTRESSDDEFDPDLFDWGDEDAPPSIDLNEVCPGEDIVETIRMGLLARDQRDGYKWQYTKPSEMRERAKQIYVSKIVMPKEHQGWFEETWPQYVFDWNKAYIHHDHPVSHLSTELNEIEMVGGLVATDTPYIDLYGNGARDEKYRRRCLTLYDFKTPKDYIRYQYANRYPNMMRLNWNSLVNGNYRLGAPLDDITMTHCLYYLDFDQMAQIVGKNANRRIHAIVHRHPESHGFLNRGEIEYWVSEEGIVTQKNVLTGETYEHPSLEGMFHNFSIRTNRDWGLTWTVRKLGGDTYLIEIVRCPLAICAEYKPFSHLKPETRLEYCSNNVTIRTFLHFTWTTVKLENGRKIPLEDVDLLNKLRRYIAGRERTPRTKIDLQNYARRLVNKADIIAIHGGGAHEVPMDKFVNYVEAAFYFDIKNELEVAISNARANKNYTSALTKYYQDQIMPPKNVIDEIGEYLFYPVTLATRALPTPAENWKQMRQDCGRLGSMVSTVVSGRKPPTTVLRGHCGF